MVIDWTMLAVAVVILDATPKCMSTWVCGVKEHRAARKTRGPRGRVPFRELAGRLSQEDQQATIPRTGWATIPRELAGDQPENWLGCHPRGIGRYQFLNVIWDVTPGELVGTSFRT